jgi:hypothetical protein
MNESASYRPLTELELQLATHMIEHGELDAKPFIQQLSGALVTSWRCPCGCASINFKVEGRPEAPPGVHILGDFVFGEPDVESGIFIFESAGTLSGIEVYGIASREAPRRLPHPAELRPVGGAW